MTVGGGGRRRVLVVSHYYPPHLGGIENVARGQAERLAAAGHQVTVLTTSPGSDGARNPGTRVENGVRVHRVPTWNGPEDRAGIPFPVPAPTLIALARRLVRDADVVHAHDAFYLTSLVAAVWCRLLRRRLVLTQHVDLVAHPDPVVRAVQRLVYATTGRFVLRTASVVTVLNDRVRAFVRPLAGARTRIELIPNAVDTELFRPAADPAERATARREFGLPADAVIALFVGRPVPKKGFDTLIAARCPEVHLAFAGGRAPETPQSPATGPAPAGCQFLGPVEPRRLAVLYRAADLFVLPSRSEGFPLTVQEAMAGGLPVITTDDPGYACYRFDRSRIALVEPEPDLLREQLRRLAADPDLRAAMGTYSRQVATTRFGWSPHLAALTAAYTPTTPPGPETDARSDRGHARSDREGIR